MLWKQVRHLPAPELCVSACRAAGHGEGGGFPGCQLTGDSTDSSQSSAEPCPTWGGASQGCVLTLVPHDAVSSQELQRGHLEERRVEQQLPGRGAPAGVLLQTLLNELLETKPASDSEPGQQSSSGQHPPGSPAAEGPPAAGWRC